MSLVLPLAAAALAFASNAEEGQEDLVPVRMFICYSGPFQDGPRVYRTMLDPSPRPEFPSHTYHIATVLLPADALPSDIDVAEPLMENVLGKWLLRQGVPRSDISWMREFKYAQGHQVVSLDMTYSSVSIGGQEVDPRALTEGIEPVLSAEHQFLEMLGELSWKVVYALEGSMLPATVTASNLGELRKKFASQGMGPLVPGAIIWLLAAPSDVYHDSYW